VPNMLKSTLQLKKKSWKQKHANCKTHPSVGIWCSISKENKKKWDESLLRSKV